MPVLLNIDIGELDDEPEELYELADVVNIACGGHAGDDASMRRALALASRHGARVAAHPSYPDRARFGRVSVDLAAPDLRATVAEQVGRLAALADDAGNMLLRVKAHGALYHDSASDRARCDAFLEGCRKGFGQRYSSFIVTGPPGSQLEGRTPAFALAFAREGFADRAYDEGGRLVPRSQPGALLTDPAACAAQALRLAREGRVDTICVHGDAPGAVAIARAVKAALSAHR